MTNYKAVLFDLDGVLVDACEWHYLAFNKALKELTNYEISREDHIKTYNGLPTLTKLDILVKEGIIDSEKVYDIAKRKQDYTNKIINEQSHLDQTKIDMLDALIAKGIKIGCVTNSISQTACSMLRSVGIYKKFDIIISNEYCNNNKPAPDQYLLAFNLLKVLDTECIIVEDSPKGLEAARKTHAKVIEVKNATEVTINLFKDII